MFRPCAPEFWQQFSCSELRLRQELQQQSAALPMCLEHLAQRARQLSHELAAAGQPLLQEWQLRRWLFLLSELAIQAPEPWQRETLLDRLYQPLIELHDLYRQYKDGPTRQFALQAELHRLFSRWQQNE